MEVASERQRESACVNLRQRDCSLIALVQNEMDGWMVTYRAWPVQGLDIRIQARFQ